VLKFLNKFKKKDSYNKSISLLQIVSKEKSDPDHLIEIKDALKQVFDNYDNTMLDDLELHKANPLLDKLLEKLQKIINKAIKKIDFTTDAEKIVDVITNNIDEYKNSQQKGLPEIYSTDKTPQDESIDNTPQDESIDNTPQDESIDNTTQDGDIELETAVNLVFEAYRNNSDCGSSTERLKNSKERLQKLIKKAIKIEKAESEAKAETEAKDIEEDKEKTQNITVSQQTRNIVMAIIKGIHHDRRTDELTRIKSDKPKISNSTCSQLKTDLMTNAEDKDSTASKDGSPSSINAEDKDSTASKAGSPSSINTEDKDPPASKVVSENGESSDSDNNFFILIIKEAEKFMESTTALMSSSLESFIIDINKKVEKIFPKPEKPNSNTESPKASNLDIQNKSPGEQIKK
jgi:hypothetical protein